MSADTWSLLCIWTAIAIYVLAFLFYGVDLAQRSGAPGSAVHARSLAARIGTSLTILGFVGHLAGALLRGMASGRVPWSNLYEFAMTGTLLSP